MPSRDGKDMPDDPYQSAETAPSPEELERRSEIVNRIREIRSRQTEPVGTFLSTEQMLREDRSR